MFLRVLRHSQLLHSHKPSPSSALPLFSSSSSSSCHSQQNQDQNQELKDPFDPQITALLHLITTSPSPDSIPAAAASSSSPSLLDPLLKRARFSHADPARLLHFFRHLLSAHPHLRPSPFSCDTLLYLLGRSRRFQDSWSLLRLLHRRDPSLITPKTLQIVLARVAKVCSARHTVDSFRTFQKLIRPFDTPCFNALLRALCQEKSMSDARNAYHSLKHEFRPDAHTFNILLSGWKSAADAESFFEEMKAMGVSPDLVTYNCLIDVHCKNRDVASARKVFDEMREREVWPDVITYTSLIGGLGLIGQPDKARDLLKEMREVGCCPDVAAYNAAIRNYCISKRLGDAFGLMDEMARRGLAPNATSYNLFFRVFYWANDLESAWRLYGRMKGEGCLPNVQSCMFLVRLCRRQEKVEMGLELWGDMVEKGFGALRLVSDVLFDMLCDWGKLEEAEKCFLEMVEKGQVPSNVSFRRIKVLMELAGRHDSVKNLSEKMAGFANSTADDKTKEIKREERY